MQVIALFSFGVSQIVSLLLKIRPRKPWVDQSLRNNTGGQQYKVLGLMAYTFYYICVP